MKFVLFTEKTVSQCLQDINERLQAKGTKARPELEGWIEKGGTFSIAVTSRVARRFPRTTRLTAKVGREGKTTVIRGHVPDGISPQWLRILAVTLVIVALALMFVNNEPMLAVVTVMFGLVAYVPLRGDYMNSETLLIEIERTLKASPRAPK